MPTELADEFYHDLPKALRQGRHLLLTPPVTVDRLRALISSLSKQDSAVFLGHGTEEGPYPIGSLIENLWTNHSGVASLEPGVLALYATEGCPRADWYVLCSDSERLASAAALWKQSGS